MTTGTDSTLRRLAVLASKARKAEAGRDAGIRAARAAGATLRQIADVTGMSHPTVMRLLAGDRPETARHLEPPPPARGTVRTSPNLTPKEEP